MFEVESLGGRTSEAMVGRVGFARETKVSIGEQATGTATVGRGNLFSLACYRAE